MYRQLDPERIIDTCAYLQRRIEYRFPGSGLGRVAAEVQDIARAASELSQWLAKPMPLVRGLVAIALAGLAALVVLALRAKQIDFESTGFSDSAQGVEAIINEIVFIGIAVFFLLSIETRIKRRRALKQLHELRSLAHIVDMHQLTKDPERIADPSIRGLGGAVKRQLTPFLLSRYLDYSSELLALISMIAAMHVQRFDDAQTMEAASGIEALTIGLSRKIWQKISLLDRDLDEAPPDPPLAASACDPAAEQSTTG